MDPTEARKFVDRLIVDLWSKGDLSAVDDLVADDFVDHNPLPGQPAGKDGLKAAVQMITAAFRTEDFTLEDVITEGDRVVDRWSTTITHVGDFFGMPATGKTATLTGIDIHRVRDGRAVEAWHIEDIAGLMQQLAPPAGGGSQP